MTLLKQIQLDGTINSLSLSNDTKEILAGSTSGKTFRILSQAFDYTILSENHTSEINDIAFTKENPEIFATIDSQG